jgi:hypothetical protein
MSKCEVCGNEYDQTFDVVMDGQRHVFDCFECAITALAPVCSHCGCKIIGHGVESGTRVYCCAHCAGQAGVQGLKDHVRSATTHHSYHESILKGEY